MAPVDLIRGFPPVGVLSLPDIGRESACLSSYPGMNRAVVRALAEQKAMDPGPEHKALGWSG